MSLFFSIGTTKHVKCLNTQTWGARWRYLCHQHCSLNSPLYNDKKCIWQEWQVESKTLLKLYPDWCDRKYKLSLKFVDRIWRHRKWWPPFLELTCCLLPINKIRKRDSINYSASRSSQVGTGHQSKKHLTQSIFVIFLVWYFLSLVHKIRTRCGIFVNVLGSMSWLSLCVTVSRISWLGRPSW